MQIYQYKRFKPQNRTVIYLYKNKYIGFIQDTKTPIFLVRYVTVFFECISVYYKALP